MPSKVRLCGVLITVLVVRVPALRRTPRTATRLVTIVARECDTFAEITGNRARNNIQETLVPLGADSPYGNPAIVPPIPNVLSPRGREQVPAELPSAVNVGVLARHRHRPASAPPTRASARSRSSPTRRFRTRHDGVRHAAAQRAGTRHRRGDPGRGHDHAEPRGDRPAQPGRHQPVAPGRHARGRRSPTRTNYGFAALRCATDNLNGDNVEWIAYPPNTRHVFCYGYYVKPRPETPGKIIIRKVLNPSGAPPTTFQFESNASFTTDNLFTLAAERRLAGLDHVRARLRSGVDVRGAHPAAGRPGSEPHLRVASRQQHLTPSTRRTRRRSPCSSARATPSPARSRTPRRPRSAACSSARSPWAASTPLATPSATATAKWFRSPRSQRPKKASPLPGRCRRRSRTTRTRSRRICPPATWATGPSRPSPAPGARADRSPSARSRCPRRVQPSARSATASRPPDASACSSARSAGPPGPTFQIRPVDVKGESYQDDLAGIEYQQVATTTRAGLRRARQAEARRRGQHRADRRSAPTRSPETVSVPDDGGLWTIRRDRLRPDAGGERAGPRSS